MELAAAFSASRPDVNVAVIGINKATPLIGPIPGSTPTAVPISTPTNANNKFCHVKATLNPSIRKSNVPIYTPPTLFKLEIQVKTPVKLRRIDNIHQRKKQQQ